MQIIFHSRSEWDGEKLEEFFKDFCLRQKDMIGIASIRKLMIVFARQASICLRQKDIIGIASIRKLMIVFARQASICLRQKDMI